jgi:hypothetical protein
MEAAPMQLSPLYILMITAITLFLLGTGTFIAGIIVLLYRAAGRQVQTLAKQTTRIAQKGVTEDIAGLVGNASSLLDSLNQLMKTTTGIGVFLSILGLLMVVAAGWLAVQLYPVWP